jgi:hypothetical protein
MSAGTVVHTRYGDVKAFYPSLEEAKAAQQEFVKRFVEETGKSTEMGYRAFGRARRDARVRASLFHITDDEFDEKCALMGYRCTWCGKVKPLERDHLVALMDGGSSESRNIVPACRDCNASRGLDGDSFMRRWPRVRREAALTRLYILRHPEVVKEVKHDKTD